MAPFRARPPQRRPLLSFETLALGAIALCALLSMAPMAAAIDMDDTLMLGSPAVSAEHVVFIYAEDLWIANHDGSDVRRLTSHRGSELRPRFSPDGSMVAFTGEYDGNQDIYVVPAAGGIPKRLTWHPGTDVVWGFAPDGQSVLFGSGRSSAVRGHFGAYEVDIDGGFPRALSAPTAFYATYSPDGARLAYNPHPKAFQQWKNYRGGRASRIWLHTLDGHDVEEIPWPEGRSNDTEPIWIGGKVYFLSDRAGEFNLFSYDTGSKAIEQLTYHEDFPILAATGTAAAGQGLIAYQQAGALHLYDVASGESRRLRIGIATDLPELRPRWASGNRWIRDAGISPSGARAAFEYRGEIVTVPAKKGDPRNITQTTAHHERSPAWSPDGATIAYFSDATGEYALHLRSQDGKGEAEVHPLPGTGFYQDPLWSPDGEHISYLDNSRTLWVFEVASGKSTKIHSDVLYAPTGFSTLQHTWSPDSRWIGYTRLRETNIRQVMLYSLADAEHHAVSDGLSDADDPAFDASGKYLYFRASTDAGPLRTWFAQSNSDKPVTYSLYLAVLPAGEPSPLAKESDEAEVTADEDGDEADSAQKKASADKGKKGKEAEAEGEGAEEDGIEIDFERLDQHILALPVSPENYADLQAAGEGQLYYMEREGPFGPGTLRMFDLSKKESTMIAGGVFGYQVSADRKKVLAFVGGGWAISGAGSKIDAGKDGIDLDGVRVRVDPREEWPQIFEEAWRINRDFFYDPGMHGADWPAMREKYARFLPHLATRSDLNDVIQWMCSELAVGHHRVGGGETFEEADEVPGGLLGADFEIHDGRYRISKVFGGLNWNPDLRAPLTEPGVDVAEGEYILAVDGAELTAEDNLFSFFEHTADRRVELRVGPNADGSDARTVHVVPLESERSLRNRDWVEGNLERVTEATDGRVAYVYVPNTTTQGFDYFKRYFFPQTDRDAIIIDERQNGGGQIADYYIDHLRRPPSANWATRYGNDLATPQGAIQGPKVMLIDEIAGSGGDMLPWMFRKYGLGKLVGKATWGGLVGILGFPTLMDGGGITAPDIGIWTEDGFIVENVGVPPDVEVELDPKSWAEGRDAQLEKAIEVALEELAKNPPKKPKRPPFPVRASPASRASSN